MSTNEYDGPHVSVVIPTYNGARHIEAALDSVRAQTYDPACVEVIVVDDGSTDGTPDLVEQRTDVRCIRQSNAGVAAARNRGVAEARADVIMLLDQDDVWEPQKTALQMAFLREHPETEIVAGHMQGFLDVGGEAHSEQVRQLLERPQPFLFPSVLAIRRTMFARVGPFDSAYAMTSDFEWLVRVRQHGIAVHMMPDLVCRYRIHAANTSRDVFGMQREMLRAMHRLRRSGNPGSI